MTSCQRKPDLCIIEDLIFQLRQRRDKVSHLQRQVEDLRKDTLRRKRKDSEEPETHPTKRREVRQEEMVPSPIKSVPTTASGTSDLRVQTTLMRIDDPPRPTPRLRAPVLTEPVRHLVPPPARNEGTLINGRPYEAAIKVTPPGPLVQNPDICTYPTAGGTCIGVRRPVQSRRVR